LRRWNLRERGRGGEGEKGQRMSREGGVIGTTAAAAGGGGGKDMGERSSRDKEGRKDQKKEKEALSPSLSPSNSL
jgi:hypothetical protein